MILCSITVRIGVSADSSTFFIDCQQVARMANNATSRTLCIIDEFGKGTLSKDGAALAASVVNCFLARGAKSCG